MRLTIREFNPERDRELLRDGVIELLETERRCDPRLPERLAMVEKYSDQLLKRRRAWRVAPVVAEESAGAEHTRSVGLLSLFLEVPESDPDEPCGSYGLISDLCCLRKPEAAVSMRRCWRTPSRRHGR